MCHSQFKERRACTTSSCNVAPHIVGLVLCCTRCWYLYQVVQGVSCQDWRSGLD